MIIPSKFITIDQSILGKSAYAVGVIRSSKTVSDAFKSMSEKFIDIDEFLLCLDLLWVIDAISIDSLTGEIDHAG